MQEPYNKEVMCKLFFFSFLLGLQKKESENLLKIFQNYSLPLLAYKVYIIDFFQHHKTQSFIYKSCHITLWYFLYSVKL